MTKKHKVKYPTDFEEGLKNKQKFELHFRTSEGKKYVLLIKDYEIIEVKGND